jgi:hypothetical protein
MNDPRFYVIVLKDGRVSIERNLAVTVEELGSVGSVENTADAEELVTAAGWDPIGTRHEWVAMPLGFVASEVTR